MSIMSLFSSFAIENQIHNRTGYWGGSEDVTHAFCEPHYLTTYYVAEFYNSISSVLYVLIGYYVLTKLHSDPYIRIGAIWLMLIGVGSTLFHGIMWYWMQLLDEIPMVGLISTIMQAKVARLDCIGTALVYIVTQKYEIFVHGFASLVVVEIILGAFVLELKGKTGTLKLRAMSLAVGCIFIGRVFWECENRFCTTYPNVWPLHVIWHVFSGLSAYYSLIANYLARLDEKMDAPELFLFHKKAISSKQD